ncbi:MAG: ImmA/IrrE family metallo-endopeptidase [Erythrobacter sp.]|uniref:ImmA/IrrE family metallo-endopeptidase n=1 Tax=Erythrobacter sp. TaxID=1042 RepID=UPI003C74354F
MRITRLDLDGIGSPRKLAERIHEVLDLPLAVPIEELCGALDIVSIEESDSTSFEAALVTDAVKSAGAILVSSSSPGHRRRFSLAHELGHFLIEAHRPREGQPLECALGDLLQSNSRDRDRRRRIEAEANAFAAHLLMPPKRIRQAIGRSGVSLETLVSIARDFEVSKEAMARAFVEANREPVAIVVSRNGQVARFYRHEDFPFLDVTKDKPLPPECAASDSIGAGEFTPQEEVEPHIWVSDRDVARILALTEQALGQVNGYALTLLQAELDDEDE